ncbi:RNA polymerase sigma factor [Youngiibacter multivorans]|uniref:RNA polymerase sigma-70 factor (ECF subfamily) n=1 Tax=Youngiibacter multivorans TaxID=937251 RepID=A0ABS4G118_9CLOT|nr:sigma-70 family RNA polymerase sigma factor [Youngiibacter multivorans]MBP1918235.1 RNA polymerase sigma-70 factor (ECF subfamily) [Youngiibacter multivorans]
MIDQYIEKHGRRLYGLCRTLCTNPSDADDLYQVTWLKVCAKIELYDKTNGFEGWLTRICVNTYRDQLRKKSRSLIFDGFRSQEAKDSVMENVSAVEAHDFSELHEAVQGLPDKLRTTIILYYYQDLDINDTAFTLKVPPGTVKSRLSKAKKLLKEMLNDEVEL